MTTKLAIKHKDSFALKENKLLQEKKCQNYKQFNLKKCEHISFSWTILGVFLVYWFVLCPLTWGICDASTISLSWPLYWPFIFWAVAFLIWIMIMCALVISWKRRLQARQNPEINLMTPKYGSDNTEKLLSVRQMCSEDANSPKRNKVNNLSNETIKNDSGNFRKKDLPPLVLHKQMSGENIDDTGVVNVENDENDQLNVASDYVERSSLQDYLKLVTVSPSEDEAKLPKSPMSPRELFFIDLIREAEKAESAKSLEKKIHFFPNETTQSNPKSEEEVENRTNRMDEKDTEDDQNVKNKENENICKNESKCGSSYFIADVESPVSEKTEVFLQIDSNEEKQLEINKEKPVLILLSNKENV